MVLAHVLPGTAGKSIRCFYATQLDLADYHIEARDWSLEEKDIRRHLHKMSDFRLGLVDGFVVVLVSLESIKFMKLKTAFKGY